MQSLVERLIQSLYACKRFKVAGSITGGGVSACNLLVSSGSSSTILELCVPYSRASLIESLTAVHFSPKTSFCSLQIAEEMASYSVSRADFLLQQQRKNDFFWNESFSELTERYESILGIGCTASLKTNRLKRSGTDRCFVSVCHASKRTKADNVQIAQRIHQTYEIIFDPQHTRQEQDQLAAFWIVYALSRASGLCQSDRMELRDHLLSKTKVTESESCRLAGDNAFDLITNVAIAPSNRFGSVLFLGDGNVESLREIIVDIPFRGLVFPGSFNPLHNGHIELIQAAQNVVQKHFHTTELPSIAFEIAVQNADKGKLNGNEIQRRTAQFSDRSDVLPVFVTNATLFSEKAKLFRQSWFVIGADTAIRLVDSKYYGDECKMAITLNEIISTLECRFVVAGRYVEAYGRYCSAMEIVENVIPKFFRHAFLPIDEEIFRNDISSTALRERAEEKLRVK